MNTTALDPHTGQLVGAPGGAQWGGMVKSDARVLAEAEAAKGNCSLLKTLGKLAIRIAIVVGIGIGAVWGIDAIGAEFLDPGQGITEDGSQSLFKHLKDSFPDQGGNLAETVARGGSALLASIAGIPDAIAGGLENAYNDVTDLFYTEGEVIDLSETPYQAVRDKLEGLIDMAAELAPQIGAEDELTKKATTLTESLERAQGAFTELSNLDSGKISPAVFNAAEAEYNAAIQSANGLLDDITQYADDNGIDLPSEMTDPHGRNASREVSGYGLIKSGLDGMEQPASETLDIIKEKIPELSLTNIAIGAGGTAAAYAGGKALSAASAPQAPNPNDIMAALGNRAEVHGPRSLAMRDAQLKQMMAEQYGVDPSMAAHMQAAQMGRV